MQDSPDLVMDARTPTGTGVILNFCLHLALEEGDMEEEHVCTFCETPPAQVALGQHGAARGQLHLKLPQLG